MNYITQYDSIIVEQLYKYTHTYICFYTHIYADTHILCFHDLNYIYIYYPNRAQL